MAVDIYLPGYNAWKDADLLKKRDQLPYMKSMVLNGSGITDQGLSLLPECTKLRELHLIGTDITDEGLRYVAELKTLDWLQIDEAKVSDAGIRHLSTLKNLNSLQIVQTGVTDNGLETLFHYPELQYLEAESDYIGGKGLSIIAQQQSIDTLRLASQSVRDTEFLNLVFCKNLKSLCYDMPLVSREAYEELNDRLPDCLINHYVHYNSQDRFNPLMLHVLELYLEGKFDYALNAIGDAARYNQKHPIVFGFRALIYLKLGSYFGFSDNMQRVKELAIEYRDLNLQSLASKYLSIENINTLQLLIAKDRPEEYFMSTLMKVYKTKPKPLIPHIIFLPNGVGPVFVPPTVQKPAQFGNMPSFEERNKYLESLGFIIQEESSISGRTVKDEVRQRRSERPEEVLLEKIRKQFKDNNQRPKGKGTLPPWEW